MKYTETPNLLKRNLRVVWPPLLAGLVVVCLLATGCGAPSGNRTTPATTTTVLSLDDPSLWPGDLVIPMQRSGPFRFVQVQVDGQDAGRFLLDTGANQPVIDNGRANRFALPDVGGGKTHGIAGATETRFRQAQHVGLGPIALEENQQAWLRSGPTRMIGMDLHRLGPKMRAGVGGILGFRSLGNVPFTFDPRADTLTLHRPRGFRPPAGATRVRLYRFHGLPVADALLFTADGDRVPIRLLLDTGMNTALSLPRELLDRHPGVASVPVSGNGRSLGVGGSLASTNTWVRQTRLFGMDLRHLPVGFEVMPPNLRPRSGPPQGRVGMAVLGHFTLTFDPDRNYLYARYLPSDEEDTSEESG